MHTPLSNKSKETTRSRPGGATSARVRARRRLAGATALLILALPIGAVVALGQRSPHARPPARHSRASAERQRRSAPLSSRAEEEAAINHVLSYTPAVVEGGHRGNEVALTFDDGPGPYTNELVATLDRLHVHATFFAIGMMERWFSSGTRAEVAAGDAVGDHTETHPMMATLSASAQREELTEQMARVEVAGAPRPRLFRPPYGSFDATTFKVLRSLHLLMVLWSTDTADYTLPGTQAIVQRALAGAHPGAIILMHDGGGNRAQTIAALPAIVAGLRRRGLVPVTVPQLLRDDPPPPGRPIPTSLAGD
ncbi:MAG TPA: polysaccharide deacetylase family protein [Solirubrobacteraceae bacterium]|nr:polysaccharide deacetylase family protein [Solirubrobacteraceae bacterium]